jgi:hypothetical protein
MNYKREVNGSWVDIDGLPEVGEWVKKEVADNVWQEQRYFEDIIAEPKPVIDITNIQIPAAELNGSIYWIAKDAPVIITAYCPLPDGNLMVMVERVIDGSNTVDDIRTKAVIVGGVMTMNFVFETSGNYIFRKSRLNEGLERIGAEFNLNFDDVEFDVFVSYP